MFKSNAQRGFTLIELLVVIAIIGILAATVLASLGSARSSGSDASVKGSVTSAKAQAEIWYNSTSTPSYTNVCTSGTNGLGTLLTAIDGNAYGTGGVVINGTTQVGMGAAVSVNCYATQTTWVISAPLNNPVGTYFCADQTGFSGVRQNATAGTPAACPTT